MITETVSFTHNELRIKTRSISNYTMSTHHFHDFFEIYYMNSGSRNYFINDTTHTVETGNLVLIKPYDLHKTMDTGLSHSRILINFKKTLLPFSDIDKLIDLCFSQSRVLSIGPSMQHTIEALLAQMIRVADAQNDFYLTHLQAQLVELLIEISRFLKSTKIADATTSPTNQKIYDIIQYLKANYSKHITLKELSHTFFISPFYLTRLFKKSTGFTCIEYIHSLRIIESQHLLKETSLKVIDIAQVVGFNNVSNFGKVFKSIIGISPLAYRKQHQ